MASLPSLPENWESDYDGDRWFYRYKPTGLVQYIFPKPGDEYPEYVDVFSPPPELSPEEKLESHYQVKRRNTAGGDGPAKSNKKGDGLTSATMSGPVDDSESNFWYQPDGLMYMGPGGYTDVSPEADEDERDEVFGRDAEKKEPPQKGPRSFISPVTSAEATPMASSSHPATATPVSEKATAAAVIAEPVPVDGPPPESPEVPMLDGRGIYSPVGYVAELASEHTAQCRDETHPAPVELPTHDMMIEVDSQPTNYADAFPLAPVELPAQSPVVRRAHHTALTTPDQKVLVPPAQHHPHPSQTSFQGSAPVNPFHAHPIPVREHRASLSTAQQTGPSFVTGPPSPTKYQPYNPERHVAPEREHRRTPVQNDHAYTAARQSHDFNRHSQVVLEDVPAVLQPPRVPPKRPIEQGDDDTYGHESTSSPVPSVLQPAGGRSGIPRPSLQDQRAQSTPDYRPYHPYQDLEQQIDSTVRLYSPPPPQDRESSVRSVPPVAIQSHLGSMGPDPVDILPGVNRANTLPTDMPALPFMGVETPLTALRGGSRSKPVYGLTHQPRDSAQAAGLRNHSSPDIRNPDFPVALKTGHNPLRTDAESRSYQTMPASSSPDAPPKPSLTHQIPQAGTSYFPAQGPTYTGHARPGSTQQFHQWQGHSAFHRPPQERPHSVQNFHASYSVTPEPPRSVEQGFRPPDAAQRQAKVNAASERVTSPVVGVPRQTLSGQQSPPIPDRKASIQSVDSADGPATRPSTASRRVSLSNPSHGFIVESSAMPPPSVQSLRNEGVAHQRSPSPQPSAPGPRPGTAAKPRPMSMQFPPSQPHVHPDRHNTSSPVHGTPVVQPPQAVSPFYQMAPPPGSRHHTQGPGQQGMWKTASNSPPPQSWQTSNRSPATQDRRSPSPTQRIAGSAPRPVSMAFQPQQPSQLGQARNTASERAERLPAPQPVPVPQPTPPASQQTGSGGASKASQGRRVPQPVPFPQPSPSPRPFPSHQQYPGQVPTRPDKLPGTHASIEAVRHTPAPIQPSQVQAIQAPVPTRQSSSRTPGTHTTNGNGVQGYRPSQPQSPSSTQGAQSRSSIPGTQTTQPQPPPSHSRGSREPTEKVGALVASQNYTIASLDTRNVTAPPHMQQPLNPGQPPSPVAVPGTGLPNNRPPPSTGMAQQSSMLTGPVTYGQASGFTQPGVAQQMPVPVQPAGQYIPQMVGGHQVFYMAPGPVPQQVFIPQATTSAHPSPAVAAPNQPQSASPPVSSPQTVAGGKEKERWFGKVFKSGSVKKQNPLTGPAVEETASQGSGQSVKSETTLRNKLQKSQPGTAQPPQPHVQAPTTDPVAGMGTPIQTMPFAQGNQSHMGQQAAPYFQPVGGNLYWSNSHHGLATNSSHVVQQGVPQQQHQQPLGQSIAPLVTPGLESNSQAQPGQQYPVARPQKSANLVQQGSPIGQLIANSATSGLENNFQPRPGRQNQQYRVSSPQLSANTAHQGSPIGQPFQPHRQSVDQGQGYFPSAGQIAAGPVMTANSDPRAVATVPNVMNQGHPSNNSTYSPIYHQKESVGEKPGQSTAEPSHRRPSEPHSLSAARGSISSQVSPAQIFVQPPTQPVEGTDQGDRDSLSRKSISSSIAPSFRTTNSMTADSAFTTAPLRPDGDAHHDAGGSSNVDNLGAGSMSMSFTIDDNNNKNKEASASVTDQIRSATTTTITPIGSGTQIIIPTGGTGNKTTAAPAATTTTTSAYYLAAQRADQLWGGRSRSNSATGAAPASGSTLAAAATPSPLSSGGSKGSSPAPPQPQASPGQTAGTTTSVSSTGAPPSSANSETERSKWDSSGYDGSGWGDEDDEYDAYGY